MTLMSKKCQNAIDGLSETQEFNIPYPNFTQPSVICSIRRNNSSSANGDRRNSRDQTRQAKVKRLKSNASSNEHNENSSSYTNSNNVKSTSLPQAQYNSLCVSLIPALNKQQRKEQQQQQWQQKQLAQSSEANVSLASSDADTQHGPVRIQRPPNAFILFNKAVRMQLKQENPDMKVAEVSRVVGERWKQLSKVEKQYYINEADKLKESQRAVHPNFVYIRRSKAELAEAANRYQNTELLETPSTHSNVDLLKPSLDRSFANRAFPRKKRHRDRNPGAPKHPLSAYMWYLDELRPTIMRNYPGSTVSQISKLCAGQWNAMDDSEREPWNAKAQADKARYAREMQTYTTQDNHRVGRGAQQKYRVARVIPAATSPSTDSVESESEMSNLFIVGDEQSPLDLPPSPSTIL